MSVSTGGRHKSRSSPFLKEKRSHSHNLDLTNIPVLSVFPLKWDKYACIHSIGFHVNGTLNCLNKVNPLEGGSCGEKRCALMKNARCYGFTSSTNAKPWAIHPQNKNVFSRGNFHQHIFHICSFFLLIHSSLQFPPPAPHTYL